MLEAARKPCFGTGLLSFNDEHVELMVDIWVQFLPTVHFAGPQRLKCCTRPFSYQLKIHVTQ
jgi:hypothetical protein